MKQDPKLNRKYLNPNDFLVDEWHKIEFQVVEFDTVLNNVLILPRIITLA